MGYTKETWVDRNVQYPSRYTDQTANTYTFTVSPGTITDAGTNITADRMNNLESGVFDAYYQSEAITLTNGVSVSLEYASGDLTTVTESTSTGTLIKQSVLQYSGSSLTTVSTVIYGSDGTTTASVYTDSLTYTSGNLTKVDREVS